MLRKGFPLEHIRAMQNAPPGASVTTDLTGTHVHLAGCESPRTAPVPINRKFPRYFDPLFSTAWTGPVNPATLIDYDPEAQVSNTLFSTVYNPTELEPMSSSIAIFVDGACLHKGKGSEARAGYGIFFGNGSKYNSHGLVDSDLKQTSQVAEIVAALKALEIVDEVWKNVGLMEVVLVSDSEYLVKSMCEYIWKWLKNGFKASTGKKVENEVLLKKLHERIEQLSEEGAQVKFWHVKRDMNQDADILANVALDSLRV